FSPTSSTSATSMVITNNSEVGMGINTFGAVDGVLLGLPWFVRYYQGGFKQAGRLAKAKISRERGAIYQSIMDLVISQYRE
ncbi:MAG: hypothetical protein AAFU33_20750, partial [Bacteroidota bacterium]